MKPPPPDIFPLPQGTRFLVQIQRGSLSGVFPIPRIRSKVFLRYRKRWDPQTRTHIGSAHAGGLYAFPVPLPKDPEGRYTVHRQPTKPPRGYEWGPAENGEKEIQWSGLAWHGIAGRENLADPRYPKARKTT